LKTSLTYGHFDTPDSGYQASPDWDQYGIETVYGLDGFMSGWTLALRYAYRDADDSVSGPGKLLGHPHYKDLQDYRMILTWDF
jgi:hypothetical protein